MLEVQEKNQDDVGVLRVLIQKWLDQQRGVWTVWEAAEWGQLSMHEGIMVAIYK